MAPTCSTEITATSFVQWSCPRWASQVALVVKNPPAKAGDIRDAGLIPGSGRSPGGGHGSPLHYSCLEDPTDREAWWAMVHSVTKTWTWLKRLSTHTHISQADLSQYSIPKMLLGINACAMKDGSMLFDTLFLYLSFKVSSDVTSFRAVFPDLSLTKQKGAPAPSLLFTGFPIYGCF